MWLRSYFTVLSSSFAIFIIFANPALGYVRANVVFPDWNVTYPALFWIADGKAVCSYCDGEQPSYERCHQAAHFVPERVFTEGFKKIFADLVGKQRKVLDDATKTQEGTTEFLKSIKAGSESPYDLLDNEQRAYEAKKQEQVVETATRQVNFEAGRLKELESLESAATRVLEYMRLGRSKKTNREIILDTIDPEAPYKREAEAMRIGASPIMVQAIDQPEFHIVQIFAYVNKYAKAKNVFGSFGLIDEERRWVANPAYQDIGDVYYGAAKVKFNDLYGFLDVSRQPATWLAQAKYASAEDFKGPDSRHNEPYTNVTVKWEENTSFNPERPNTITHLDSYILTRSGREYKENFESSPSRYNSSRFGRPND